MTLKEFEGSTVLRALRALGDKLALEDASNVALAVGVTRTTQVPVMDNREQTEASLSYSHEQVSKDSSLASVCKSRK